jgi:hypothetical protein
MLVKETKGENLMLYRKNIKAYFLAILFIVFSLTSCTIAGVSQQSTSQEVITGNADKDDQQGKIDIKILGESALSINKDRITDDVYGTNFLDNRWSLDEIDTILNAIKGSWKADKYIGFVASSIYFPELFDPNDNIGEERRAELIKSYEERVEQAQSNIPEFSISIKERNGTATKNNYVYVDGNYPSPISIILSQDRSSENYPVFKDQTTISTDFHVDYPVIYIKCFTPEYESDQTIKYEPATLLISSDSKFYILKDGAFYSLRGTADISDKTHAKEMKG